VKTVLLLGLLVGLDNLQVGAALGLVPSRARRRWLLALAFGVCETGMPLVGLALGGWIQRLAGPWADGIGAAVLALCGVVIIVSALRGEEDAAVAMDGRLAWIVLPVSLSLDNLFAGVGLGSLGYPVIVSALIIGLVSSSLCLLGLLGGGWLGKWIPERAEILSGVYLIGLAIFRLFGGGFS
jgi:putative Mn2+ efflux pump MntP